MPTIEEFGQSIKKKYPQYQSIDDKELGTKFLQKHPEYQDRVFDTDPDTQASIVQPKTKGILDAFVKGARNIKDSIVKSGEDVADIQESNLSTGGKILGTFGKFMKPFAQIGAEAVATPLRVAGEVFENATEVDVNEATSKAIQSLVEKGMSTETAQNVIKKYDELKKTNPEAANAMQSALDIADFATIGAGGAKAGIVGAKASLPVIKGAAKVGAKTGEVASSFAGKVGRTTGASNVSLSEAVGNIKQRLLHQIEGKSSSLKKLDKTRSDILDTISTNKNYHPEIDAENKTFNVGKAVQNMDADIQTYSQELGGLFKRIDTSDGGIKTDEIIGDMMKHLMNKKNAERYVVGGKSVFGDIEGMIERMKSAYGDVIPRERVWEIRKLIDQNIETISDTNIKKSVRQDVRKAFANSLERSVQGEDSDLVKRAMGEIGKIIEARDYSRDVLQGFKIQGGKLTDIIRNAFAGNVGQVVGAGVGGAFGNIPGAVVGYGVGSKLGQWLAKNALTNAADRKALRNLVKERPEVFDEIKTFIKGMDDEAARQNALKNMRFLESPKLMSPGVKGGSVDFGKKPLPSLPEGNPNTIPGATIRLKQKTESTSFSERIAALKERNKPKVSEPTIMTKKDLSEFRYHVTSEGALQSIKKGGLKPSQGQYGKGVYFAPNEKLTGGYGSKEEIMIRIKKSALPEDYDEFPEQGWTEKNVPAKFLEYKKVGEKNWKPVV